MKRRGKYSGPPLILSMGRLVLCNEKTPRVEVHVWAEFFEGCLTIWGQDLGKGPQSIFGEEECEYFYRFDRANTRRLLALLAPEGQHIKKRLVQRFGGIEGCSKLREFCDQHLIKYQFFLY